MTKSVISIYECLKLIKYEMLVVGSKYVFKWKEKYNSTHNLVYYAFKAGIIKAFI